MRIQVVSVFVLSVIIMGCSKPQVIVKRFNDESIIHYSEMKDDNDIVNKVIYLNGGDMIPVEMNIKSDVIELESEKVNLVLKQKVFMRLVMPEGSNIKDISTLSEKEKLQLLNQAVIYLSSDAIKWARSTEFKAVKKIFGISGGSLSMGFGITKNDGPKLSLSAMMSKRDR